VTIAPGLWADGKSAKQHHQQWHDMKLSKHYNQSLGMTCVTCHDPHQNTAQKFQLKEDFNSLTVGVGCVKCHANKATATNGINDHSKHAQTISQCASCHMTHNAKTANDYDISNHSFMPIRPNATRTYSGVTGGMINTCAVSCHRNGKGTRGTGKNFGITDASLTNWAEATDIQLADTLWKYYQTMYGVSDVKMLSADFPASFNLLQNYPNPFNPTTKIRFEVPSIANVKIEIYNVSGELINVLINRQLTAGSYNVEWDGKSVYGIGVPSGVYIYRMVANNNFSAAKKMLLTK
jgi:predicted CXXCH cytochrome family protein